MSSMFLIFFQCCVDPRHLHSFPTRRSSDLPRETKDPHHAKHDDLYAKMVSVTARLAASRNKQVMRMKDRKSTRLNSSHLVISYAVFCLKKKKIDIKSLTNPITSHHTNFTKN